MIIGLAGKKGSGKDTIAEHLGERYQRHAFARPLKVLASCLYDCSEDQLFGPSALRESVVTRNVSRVAALEELEKLVPGDSANQLEVILSTLPESCPLRQVLQYLGNDWGRGIDPMMWAKRVIQDIRLSAHPNHTITDVRYQNEAELIWSLGGFLVWVDAHKRLPPTAPHPSEPEMRDFSRVDYIVPNNGDKALLPQRIWCMEFQLEHELRHARIRP